MKRIATMVVLLAVVAAAGGAHDDEEQPPPSVKESYEKVEGTCAWDFGKVYYLENPSDMQWIEVTVKVSYYFRQQHRYDNDRCVILRPRQKWGLGCTIPSARSEDHYEYALKNVQWYDPTTGNHRRAGCIQPLLRSNQTDPLPADGRRLGRLGRTCSVAIGLSSHPGHQFTVA